MQSLGQNWMQFNTLTTFRAIPGGWERIRALSLILPHLETAQQVEELKELLNLLKFAKRPHALEAISTIIPTFHALGGDRLVENVTDAVLEVVDWWR